MTLLKFTLTFFFYVSFSRLCKVGVFSQSPPGSPGTNRTSHQNFLSQGLWRTTFWSFLWAFSSIIPFNSQSLNSLTYTGWTRIYDHVKYFENCLGYGTTENHYYLVFFSSASFYSMKKSTGCFSSWNTGCNFKILDLKPYFQSKIAVNSVYIRLISCNFPTK